MITDFLLNGVGTGSVASRLMASDFNPDVLRPWIGADGRSYINVTQNGKSQAIVTNATATLRKDEWIQLDETIIRVAKPRLRAFGDLRAFGSSYTIPNGMGKTMLEYQTMGNVSGATISMDGLRKSEADRPVFDLKGIPLPIIHKDFHFTARQLATSRNGGSPLDTTMAEEAARKVAEEAERLTLGLAPDFEYGGGKVYGYTNFPSRNTYELTLPTEEGWTPQILLAEILAMKARARADNFFGPFVLYFSSDWDLVLDDDYDTTSGVTTRARLKMIDGITDVRTVDYLEDYQVILVQPTSDVARAIIGMDITTLQWEEQGGMQLCFKVMAILVPQLRADYDGNCGIVHGVAVAEPDNG